MQIALQDGSVLEISSRDECRIAFGEIIICPAGAVPADLACVWDDPPTYAQLLPVRAERVAAGDYMLSARGLTQIVSVAYE
jgi:hypothetical protein